MSHQRSWPRHRLPYTHGGRALVKLPYPEIVPDGALAPQQRVHLEAARATMALAPGPFPRPAIMAAKLPWIPQGQVIGLYTRGGNTIYIDTHRLWRYRDTLDTLAHEGSHWRTGADDLTTTHQQGTDSYAREIAALYSTRWPEIERRITLSLGDGIVKHFQW